MRQLLVKMYESVLSLENQKFSISVVLEYNFYTQGCDRYLFFV